MVLQVWLYVNKIIPHPHVGGVMSDNCVVGQKSVTAPPQWYEHRHVTKYDTMTSSSTQPTPHNTILYYSLHTVSRTGNGEQTCCNTCWGGSLAFSFNLF